MPPINIDLLLRMFRGTATYDYPRAQSPFLYCCAGTSETILFSVYENILAQRLDINLIYLLPLQLTNDYY